MLLPIRSRGELAGKQRITRISVALTLALTISGRSGVVRADAKSDAQAQFEAGRDAAKRGDCPTAIDHFTRARAIYPTAGSLYNIADCEERIGRLVSARAHWSDLLRELPARDERVADAKARVEALDRRTPTVKIVLPPFAPAGTSMEIDGSTIAPSKIGVEQPINPGQHAIAVAAPGHTRGSTNVVVAEGARGFVVKGELGPLETPTAVVAPKAEPTPALPTREPVLPTTDAPRENGNSRRSTLAYVAGTVGVVGLAASTVATVVLLGKKSTLANNCDGNKNCDDTGFAATSNIATWSAIGTVGFGAGVLGIAGFFLLPRASSREVASDDREPSRAPRLTAINPSAGPTFVGAQLTGAW